VGSPKDDTDGYELLLRYDLNMGDVSGVTFMLNTPLHAAETGRYAGRSNLAAAAPDSWLQTVVNTDFVGSEREALLRYAARRARRVERGPSVY